MIHTPDGRNFQPVNRSAIVVQPKEPLIAWARGLQDGPPIDSMSPHWLCSVYLVEANEEEMPEAVLKRHFGQILDDELESWCLNQEEWPLHRDFELFVQWFDARVVDLVRDVNYCEEIEHDIM